MAKRPQMSENVMTDKMRELDDRASPDLPAMRKSVDDKRAEPEAQPSQPVPAAAGKKYYAATREGMKRITTLIDPAFHRSIKIQVAMDGITMEEAFRTGLRLYLESAQKQARRP